VERRGPSPAFWVLLDWQYGLRFLRVRRMVAVEVVMVTGQREDEYDVVVIGGGAAGAMINADLVEEEAREAVVAVPL
jgi:hypothetical protein